MLTFFVGFVAVALGQVPLELAQHVALMNVYEGVGCNTTICPRFGSSSNCTGRMLICAGGKVTHLDFGVAQLTGNGTIPPVVGQLTALTRLSLYNNFNNRLSGTIPTTIGQLTMLGLFDLRGNQLTGSIPTAIGQMSSLVYLFLDHNRLTGTIPSSIGLLPRLQSCSLQLGDMNCLDCSTSSPNCSCATRSCAPQTTPTMSTTGMPTTTPAATTALTSSASASAGALTSFTAPAEPASMTSSPTSQPATLSMVVDESDSTSTAANMPHVTAMVDTEPQVDTALVGGLVSGIIAIVVILALVAYVVWRKRRSNASETHDGPAMQYYSDDSQSHTLRAPASAMQYYSDDSQDSQSHTLRTPASNSNYDRIVTPTPRYIQHVVVAAAPTPQYGALEQNEIQNL